ncbi:probable serine/threonine-protein kinase DDB_G0278535 [Salmo trutta]|uniref:probable serine/threonine-protein kinase DDB_G0278535 n=1 Tax=Salmo trutta TaxID=8032 RepID=UPI0011324D2C|nr:probable serine/threonine-protein kinase DDB_G0278535 [Salmo trutta]
MGTFVLFASLAFLPLVLIEATNITTSTTVTPSNIITVPETISSNPVSNQPSENNTFPMTTSNNNISSNVTMGPPTVSNHTTTTATTLGTQSTHSTLVTTTTTTTNVSLQTTDYTTANQNDITAANHTSPTPNGGTAALLGSCSLLLGSLIAIMIQMV